MRKTGKTKSNKLLTLDLNFALIRIGQLISGKQHKNSKSEGTKFSYSKQKLTDMLMSTFLLLFCLTFAVQASSVKEYQDEIPGHEGECIGKDRKFYKLGETMTGDQDPCTRKICRGTAAPGSVYVEVESCSKVNKQPGCELKSDAKKSFPECCARLECKHH